MVSIGAIVMNLGDLVGTKLMKAAILHPSRNLPPSHGRPMFLNAANEARDPNDAEFCRNIR
jgi:hypothetical protein